MNSRLTLGLAIVLLLGAIVAGYWGVVLSRQPAPAAPAVAAPAITLPEVGEIKATVEKSIEDEQRVPVVVVAREIKPYVPVTREDLTVEQLKIAPPDSFHQVEAVLGRTTWRAIAAGSVLNEASFESGGPLARMIRPEERALSVPVDELIGNGGYISPGDFVDVLLYLKQDDKNRDQTVQVVVPALRLLAYGDNLGPTNAGEAALPPASSEDEGNNNRRQASRPSPARIATLAVPEKLLTRFMMATQVGTLRLAVRSFDEKLLEDYRAGKPLQGNIEETARSLFQFEKLALRTAPRARQTGLVQARPPAVEIHRGTSVTRQTP